MAIAGCHGQASQRAASLRIAITSFRSARTGCSKPQLIEGPKHSLLHDWTHASHSYDSEQILGRLWLTVRCFLCDPLIPTLANLSRQDVRSRNTSSVGC